MDKRLQKRNEVLGSLLSEAQNDLDLPVDRPTWVEEQLTSFSGFMERQEFEMALDALQTIGTEFECSADFWRRMKQACDVLDLNDRRNYLRGEYRKARKREGAA